MVGGAGGPRPWWILGWSASERASAGHMHACMQRSGRVGSGINIPKCKCSISSNPRQQLHRSTATAAGPGPAPGPGCSLRPGSGRAGLAGRALTGT